MDPLGEALHFLRMSGTSYCTSDLTAPWGLQLPEVKGGLTFHVLTSGRCWLEVPGSRRRQLEPGDLVLVPHGEGHRLVSKPGTRAPRIDDLPHGRVSDRYKILRHGGGGESAHLVCGSVRLHPPAAPPPVPAPPQGHPRKAPGRGPVGWLHRPPRLNGPGGR